MKIKRPLIPASVAMLLLFASVLVYIYFLRIEEFWAQTEEQIAIYTKRYENEIGLWFSPKMKIMDMFSDNLVYFDLTEKKDLEKYLTNITENNQSLMAAYIATEDKKVVFNHGQTATKGFDPTIRVWYKKAVENSGKVVVSEPYIDILTGKLVVTICKTVKLNNGLHGVAGIDFDLTELIAFVSNMNPYSNGSSFLLSEKGYVITHADSAFLPKKINNDVTFVKYEDISRSIDMYVSKVKIDEVNWFYGNEIPVSDFNNRLRKIIFPLAIAMLLGFVLFTCVVTFYLNHISKLNKIAKNQLDERMQMFGTTPLAITIWNRNIQVIDCNENAEKLFGFSSRQELLDGFMALTPEFQPNGMASLEMMPAEITKAFEEGYSIVKWTHGAVNGEIIPLDVPLVRFKYGGDYIVVAYARDLREHNKMLENIREIEEHNKAKSMFLARMSHEIRTPMNAVIGFTEIELNREENSPEIKESLNKIYNSSYTLLGIINDILDLSKIESGKLELLPIEYDVASLINDTVQLNIMRLGSKEIEFVLRVSENLPVHMFGDELRIRQVLNNLLSNAFKYTEKGRVTLSFEAEAQSAETTMLTITVSDTGQGMTKEQVAKLFDEYSRFNMGANRTTEGTGLGMSITKNLIDMMNGKITVESESGIGSVFTVQIPQQIQSPDVIGKELSGNLQNFRSAVEKQAAKIQITREYMPYGSVLVVDDVEMNLFVARGLLTPYGLKVETAGSGFEALAKIQNGRTYDIIFMDHMMPKMDGIETAKLIRKEGYTQPIVALTANAITGQAEMFTANGFDGYLSKPIDIRQLDIVLNKLIKVDTALLEVFVRDAKKALPIIEATLENISNANEEELHTFAINVHSMKSSFAIIGEKEASQIAALMEKAGKEQDKAAIEKNAPNLIEALRATISKVEANNTNIAVADTDDTACLQKQLKIIVEACTEYDDLAASAALAELEKMLWTEKTTKAIAKISENILHGDFEGAKAEAEILNRA